MDKVIYTLGYGGHGLDEFLSIIDYYLISIIIDVRRFPKSKIPYYNKDYLEKIFMHKGIRYYWLGEYLGGYRGGYRKYMMTEQYRLGIAIMEKLIQQTIYGDGKPVIICLEQNPRGCHRKYIAETLQEKGYMVIHIIEKNKAKEHKKLIESAGGGI